MQNLASHYFQHSIALPQGQAQAQALPAQPECGSGPRGLSKGGLGQKAAGNSLQTPSCAQGVKHMSTAA